MIELQALVETVGEVVISSVRKHWTIAHQIFLVTYDRSISATLSTLQPLTFV